MVHKPVLLKEIIDYLPQGDEALLLDATFGGGGHFQKILLSRPSWRGIALDQDPLAIARAQKWLKVETSKVRSRVELRLQNFSRAPDLGDLSRLPLAFALADLGVSSFQLDDKCRGMSLDSDEAPNFCMASNKAKEPFYEWVQRTPLPRLVEILEEYGEEPKARLLAKEMKSWGMDDFSSAKILASKIASSLRYPTKSRRHPATRSFQAFRIAINDELGALEAFLGWAPQLLATGGRLAVISFHSLEDRVVKNRFRDLEQREGFDILTKKPVMASNEEVLQNTRSRSAKLRVIEKT